MPVIRSNVSTAAAPLEVGDEIAALLAVLEVESEMAVEVAVPLAELSWPLGCTDSDSGAVDEGNTTEATSSLAKMSTIMACIF